MEDASGVIRSPAKLNSNMARSKGGDFYAQKTKQVVEACANFGFGTYGYGTGVV